jgi:methylmalonyl-CoA mutase
MFPKSSPEEWKEKIVADLKGKDFDKTLVWPSADGLAIQPFYTSTPDDQQATVNTGKTSWEIIEHITVSDAITAHQMALEALSGGANAIRFELTGDVVDPDVLCKDILLDVAPVYFENLPTTDRWEDFFGKNPQSLLHTGTDMLKNITSGKCREADLQVFSQWLSVKRNTQAVWDVLLVDASIFKNSGGSILHELGFALAALQEQLHLFQNEQIAVGKIILKTAIGQNFFFEIAKLRALRSLAKLITDQYQFPEVTIHAESAGIYASVADRHTNILRQTTMAMSAVLGKADGIQLQAYEDTSTARRVTRNIHHLLMEESHFDKFADPAAGSYYIGQLTHDMKEAAWKMFLEVESKGGYIACFNNGWIPEQVAQHRRKLESEIAFRKNILLGVNQFPNLKDDFSGHATSSSNMISSGLQPIRLAEPFEALRAKTAHAVAQGEPMPKAYLWKHGDPVMSTARATWSLNFMGCAGIACLENPQPNDWEDSLNNCLHSGAQIVVLCSDNDSWETFIPRALAEIPDHFIIVLAGKGSFEGVDFSIYEGCNVMEVLENILKRTGVVGA